MRIRILGSGLMGGKRGALRRAGHEAAFSLARSRAKFERLAGKAGVQYGAANSFSVFSRPGLRIKAKAGLSWPTGSNWFFARFKA